MKRSDRYLKIVEWSEEEGCYVGTCPELMLGGVHGMNAEKVYRELCQVAEEWIRLDEEDGEPLPEPTAGKDYSGKLVVRVGKELHRKLAIEALRRGISLNSCCKDALREREPGYRADKSARPTPGARLTPHRRVCRPSR